MPSTLFYLGPKLTWSHAAAQKAKQDLPAVANAALVPLPSADELFNKLASEPQCAAIIPTYNLEQGIVYDFARFQLFDEIGSIDLKTRMCLFGRVNTIKKLKRIYTKDTVLPQVSLWLDQLPSYIEIVARPDISTAKGVAMAAAEEDAGAICSEAAGHAHNLHPLALDIANNPENYTAFSVFQHNRFPQTDVLHTPPEYGFGIDEAMCHRIRQGGLIVLWHISGVHNQKLHLGHLSAVLTLRSIARFQNKILVQIEKGSYLHDLKKQISDVMGNIDLEFQTAPDRKGIFRPGSIPSAMKASLELRADIRGCERVKGREDLHLKLMCNHQVLLYAINNANVDLVVAGPSLLPDLKMIDQHMGQVIPTILTDYLPGTDNYAKMSAKRMNQIDWAAGWESKADQQLPNKLLDIHFSADRLRWLTRQ